MTVTPGASVGGDWTARRLATVPWLALVLAVCGVVVASRSRPTIAIDDAAIAFRYAERLATGRGFTYNDHEHVLGASNGLYVLVLAAAARAGADVEAAASAVGLVSYGVCVGLVAILAVTMAGRVGALVATFLLLSDPYLRFPMLSGLEVGLALALGLSVIAAVSRGRLGLAGVMAGLAVWVKLDALALVTAVLLVEGWRHRRVPWRFVAAVAVVAGPWLLWSTWYFGSPIPHSLVVKIAGEGQRFDPWWVVRFLSEPGRRITTVLAVLSLVLCKPASAPMASAAKIWFLWAALHGMAYSIVDLGAPYPWYMAVPLLSISALSGIAIGGAMDRAHRHQLPLWCALPIGALAALALTASTVELSSCCHARPLEPWEMFEADRRAAGRFLRVHAAAGEVLECAYGWPAFASRLPTNDRSGLNSRALLSPVTYRVEHGSPADHGSVPPQAPPGMIDLATFDSARRRFPGYSWFVVYGRPESVIARKAPGRSPVP